MLTALGLDAAAESVYRAMLVHPHEDVADLSARLGLSEAEVRRALDVLSALMLVRASYEREGKLHALSPEMGLKILMARQQADLAAHQQRVDASRAAAAQLIAEYADRRSDVGGSSPVQELIGLDEIRDRIATLAAGLQTEIMTFAPGGAHKPESIEASKPHDRSLLRRGVRMRTVYLDSVRNSQATAGYISWLLQLGGEVRTVPELPIRMIIFDSSTALIPLHSDDSATSAVVLTGQGPLTALRALFESVWNNAHTLNDLPAPTRDAQGLTPQEAAVVGLLAQGLTDQAIGKRLGVSPRTARRVATDLMDRLGARSRFEFGTRAVQHGWLSARP